MPKYRYVGWDVETSLITKHDPAPPLVCLSMAGGPDTREVYDRIVAECTPATLTHDTSPQGEWAVLGTRESAQLIMTAALAEPDVCLVAHNGGFDWTVWIRYMRELGYPDYAVRGVVLNLAEVGRIEDTLIREKLLTIASGDFKFDRRRDTGIDPKTGKKKLAKTMFGLDYVVGTYFGEKAERELVAEKKGDNAWRLRYAELRGVPMDKWPEAAVNYAIEDAVWAYRVRQKQSAPVVYSAGAVVNPDGTIVDEISQTGITLPLYWIGETGFRTDPAAVAEVKKEVRRDVQHGEDVAMQLGIVRVNGCTACNGTGFVSVNEACLACGGGHCSRLAGKEAGVCATCKRRRGTCADNANMRYGSIVAERLQEHVRRAYEDGDEDDTPVPRTEKGAISTDKDALRNSGDPLLIDYEDGAFARRMLQRYIPDLEAGSVDRLREPPNSLVSTGRTSWKHQQPPRKGGFRECVVPDEGNVFMSCDYSAIELGALAQVCLVFVGYSKLADAINKGIDPHLLFGIEILATTGVRLTYEEAYEALKNEAHPLHREIKDYRQRAKAANFGFPGGMGWRKFVAYAKGYGVRLTKAQAKDLRDLYFHMWPEVRTYLKAVGDMTKDGPAWVQQMGSKRIRQVEWFSQAANTYFQGLAADGGKAALWALTKEMYVNQESPLYGVRAWGYVHDEVLFEGPEETAHLWAPLASKIMVEQMRKYLPNVRVEAEPALMRRWYKDAAPVFDEDGKLIPWEPRKEAA